MNPGRKEDVTTLVDRLTTESAVRQPLIANPGGSIVNDASKATTTDTGVVTAGTRLPDGSLADITAFLTLGEQPLEGNGMTGGEPDGLRSRAGVPLKLGRSRGGLSPTGRLWRGQT